MWSLIVSDYSTVTTILNGLPFNSNDYSERSEESASDETLRCAQSDYGGETFATLRVTMAVRPSLLLIRGLVKTIHCLVIKESPLWIEGLY